MQLSLLASTPDIATTGYMVNLLLGTPELVAAEAKAAGYDGIEFFPGPPGTIGVAEMDRALEASDVVLTAVNSGRIVAEGLTLLHADPAVHGRALNRLKCSVADAVAWIRRINDPAFGLMLDTHQLHRKEASVTEGLRAAAGAEAS
jgi:sugar phosphate isomerase/epimerase